MSIRVALIGNMNNNHFALMRYLRDIGLDAHLLMYSQQHEHFFPQCDTWEWKKWAQYVHQMPFMNGGIDLFALSKAQINAVFNGFDFYIGNGIAPVLFWKANRHLDIFIPYCDGIEFIIEHSFRLRHPRSSLFSALRKILMKLAISRNVRTCITANLHPTVHNAFRGLKVTPLNLPVPMVYLETPPEKFECEQRVTSLIARMQQSRLVVFSHVSHIWKNLPVPHYMGGVGKRNNWLVQGFAQYIRESANSEALLCLFDYGRDVAETKKLIDQLGISRQVVWFPVMNRKEIMHLLRYADVGGSEFAGMYWGGCGWEFLANGVPMFHQLGNPEKYQGAGDGSIPLAPFYNVNSPEEIARILLENDRESFKKTGAECRRWFDEYQGYALARRYKDLILNMYEGRQCVPLAPLPLLPRRMSLRLRRPLRRLPDSD